MESLRRRKYRLSGKKFLKMYHSLYKDGDEGLLRDSRKYNSRASHGVYSVAHNARITTKIFFTTRTQF